MIKKCLAALLAGVMVFSLAACGTSDEQSENNGEQTAKTVETDLANMTWDEILEEAKGQEVTLNVYNADTQVAKYWDSIVELAKDYDIDVTVVAESGDTDARMIEDYKNGDVASYDMTWGYYGGTFKAYHDAGCLWGDEDEQWVKYLPNAKYIDWESNIYSSDCGLPVNYMQSPLMGLTPMLIYLGSEYDASLAWDETNGDVTGLFHNLTELRAWVEKYPGKFTYLDLAGSGAFHGRLFVLSALYELTSDGNGGWKAVYDEDDDMATRYEKIEANAQSWYEWASGAEASMEAFVEKADYVWAYLNEIEPYLLQGDSGALYGKDAYEMANYVNSGVLATSFTTSFSISPKVQNDPSYLQGSGQAFMMQTSVFASDFMVITKNSDCKAACMVLCNLMLDPTIQADGFAVTGNTYNVDLTKLDAEDSAYFDKVFSELMPGTTPSADDLANYSHVNIGGAIPSWLTDCWTENVVNK